MPAADCVAAIQILPNDVVSRIAAGEVIERPAAVAKELIENSLDANARLISVDVKNGGLSLIRVTDDGDGIRRSDLLLAFKRHATSKLRTDRDLASVTTMGFRGEALPSIASVSRVDVTTSTGQDKIGARMVLIGGRQQSMSDEARGRGTTVSVADLFCNQPARKKFLKSPATEFSHIAHSVQQAALAWPSVHFRLTHNGEEVLNCPSVESDRDRILQIYRSAFLNRAVEVRGRVPGCAIRGMTVDPVHARASKVPQELFVNRRPVKNATVFHAITEAYGSRLTKGCSPTFVLFLDIDPDRIDVNVHPTKREIRFSQAEPVHQLVGQALRHAFSGPERTMALKRSVMEAQTEAQTHRGEGKLIQTGGKRVPIDGTAGLVCSGVSKIGQDAQLTFVREIQASYGQPTLPEVVPLGQILGRYLVVQVGSELQIIDQHTAHERVLFERLWRRWLSRQVTSQPLLIPEPVEVPAAACSLLQRHFGDLESLGLVIEPFGTTAIVIRAVPADIGQVDAASLVQDLLDDLTEGDRSPSLEDRLRPVLASLACHSAVRAGRSLALPEIKELVQDWVEEGLVTTCPHGRRTAFRLSTDELDKLFGRVGWS